MQLFALGDPAVSARLAWHCQRILASAFNTSHFFIFQQEDIDLPNHKQLLLTSCQTFKPFVFQNLTFRNSERGCPPIVMLLKTFRLKGTSQEAKHGYTAPVPEQHHMRRTFPLCKPEVTLFDNGQFTDVFMDDHNWEDSLSVGENKRFRRAGSSTLDVQCKWDHIGGPDDICTMEFSNDGRIRI